MSMTSMNLNLNGFGMLVVGACHTSEWEYAARAFGMEHWSGSNIRKEVSWADQEESKPVGLLKPNRWGLSGMSGNIGEICWDAYDEDTYQTARQVQ